MNRLLSSEDTSPDVLKALIATAASGGTQLYAALAYNKVPLRPAWQPPWELDLELELAAATRLASTHISITSSVKPPPINITSYDPDSASDPETERSARNQAVA